MIGKKDICKTVFKENKFALLMIYRAILYISFYI